MDRYSKLIHATLRSSGSAFLRDGKHYVWRLPDGQMFSFAKTPSDVCSNLNAWHRLRRMLGLVHGERGLEGVRTEKVQHKHRKPLEETSLSGFALPELGTQLAKVGLQKQTLVRRYAKHIKHPNHRPKTQSKPATAVVNLEQLEVLFSKPVRAMKERG